MTPRADRQFVDCPVQFTRDDGVTGEGRIFNVSLDGCAVRSRTPVVEGMYLSLTIEGLGDPPISIELARTRWASSDEFGVKFLILYQKHRHALLRWLQAIASGRKVET